MINFEDKLAGINATAVEIAKIARTAMGVDIPEDKIATIVKRAEGKLQDDIFEQEDKVAASAQVCKAIREASNELKDEELSSNNKDKTGGSVMSAEKRFLPKREKDFIDEVNDAGDKIAAGQGPVAGTEVRMMHIQKDPVGAIAVAFEKLGNLAADIDKIAEAIGKMEADVATIASKDAPGADAVVQDETGKDEGADETVIVDAEKAGLGIMTGDPSGQKSKPTNPAVAGAGGVAANPKATVGDVIANANKAQARVANVLKGLKKA